MLEDKVLRKILGPRMMKYMGNLVKLHNKELDNLCKASSIVRTVKSRL
jgi:hypothetical protein